MALADEAVLDMIEGEFLSRKFVNDLLALVNNGEANATLASALPSYQKFWLLPCIFGDHRLAALLM